MTPRLLTEPPPEITIRGSYFCFTGEFVHHRRKDYEQLVTAAKGRVRRDVDCALNYLVVGDGSLCGEEEIQAILEHTKVRTALRLIAFGDQRDSPTLSLTYDKDTGALAGLLSMGSTNHRDCRICIVSETQIQLALGV